MLRSKKFWVFTIAVLSLALTSCGKNDPFVPIGQAPAPVNNPYYNPNGYNPNSYPNYYPGQNQGGGYPNYPTYYYPNPNQYAPNYQPNSGYPSPYFAPQLPQGYPQQYTPFLPVDNYMRRNPQLNGYWNQFWGQWTQFCQATGRNPYDFNYFWNSYCPQQWRGTQYWDMYRSFDTQFYSWMSPGYQFDLDISAGNFWYYYTGHPYQSYDDLGYCGSYCNYY